MEIWATNKRLIVEDVLSYTSGGRRFDSNVFLNVFTLPNLHKPIIIIYIHIL